MDFEDETNSLDKFIENDVYYKGYESNTDCEDNINNYYDYYNEKLKDENNIILNSIEKNIKTKKCFYLTLHIYNNVLIKDCKNPKEFKYEYKPSQIDDPDLKLCFMLKVGYTEKTFYDRFKGLLRKNSPLTIIPITIMHGDNVKDVEKKFHNEYDNEKLKILIKINNHFIKETEFYEASDNIANYFYEFSKKNNLELVYNIIDEVGDIKDWFDVIPDTIQKTLKKMFQEKELLMLVKDEDNLDDDIYNQTNKFY